MKLIIKRIKEIAKNISEIIFFAINVLTEPFLLLAVDIMNGFVGIRDETSNGFHQAIINLIEKIRNREGRKAIINISALLYYVFLTYIAIGFAGYIIHQGKIPAFKIEELMLYGILYIIATIMMLNISLKHSEWSVKIKLFVIIQTLAIIPVIAAYWIVSIEGKTFYLNKLDINQWSSIFNNMLIYIATCIFGISQAYKKEKEVQ